MAIMPRDYRQPSLAAGGTGRRAYDAGMALTKHTSVSWNTSQGETTGKTVEKKTSDFTFAGQKFKPTDDDPFWIVESDKTGKQAAHKESSLTER
jgi:Hypervirulence associated proteins TUDOR domain